MSKSVLVRAAEARIRHYCGGRGRTVKGKIRHVYPRCYVVGRNAEQSIVVARPWQDAEPHLKERVAMYPLVPCHEFEDGIQSGEFVALGYVILDTGSQLNIAVRMPG